MKYFTSTTSSIIIVLATLFLTSRSGASENAVKSTPDTIYSVAFSHGDLGYGNYPHVLRTENRLENLFRSIQYCDSTSTWPSEAQYHWQQEMAEPLPLFLSSCTPEQREKLARYVREGRISIPASLSTVLGDRLNSESAARLFYLGGRLIPDLLGTPRPQIVMINDVTGLPWSLPIYCEAAKVPFLISGHNGCGKMDELETAPLVRWEGPGGTGSVLAFSCVYNDHAVSKPAEQVPGAVARDARRITPEFVPVWLQGHDFAVTSMDMSDAVKAWNEKNSHKVQMATFDLYLNELARRQPAEKTPTFRKTGPCQWMDQTITDAWQFGRARMAGERLPAAEKFSSIALASTQGGYPWFDLTIAWHNLLSNYEHTVGAACWRVKDAEGWRHYETEKVEHRQEALLAANTADRTLDDALTRISYNIKTTKKNTIAVFNSLSRPRTDVVTFRTSASGKNLVAVDDSDSKEIPCQSMENGTITFVAENVPALGYRTYHLIEKKTAAVTENPFYRIKLDPASGTITSLYDKELKQEFVNTQAPHAFNQYIYEWYENPKVKEPKWSSRPSGAKITTTKGSVATVIRIRAMAEGVRWLEQTITLYHATKRIDFDLRMDKKPSGRLLADYIANNLRGKESVFIGLPFNIPNFKAVYQTGGGGVAEPIRDQFHGTGTAFHAVQHFTDLSNDKFGVTVSPIDFSLVEFGHPRSDVLSRIVASGEAKYEQKMEYPDNSSVYLYLMDNMFTTNILIDQRGEQRFRWAMRSHAGNWQEGRADQFGDAVNQPLAACLIQSRDGNLPEGTRSFASVDAENVAISTIKPAEWNGEGYIVRLNETAGRKTTFTLDLPFLTSIDSAMETTLTEDNLKKSLVVSGTTVHLEIPAFGVKTLRVRPSGTTTSAVAGLQAKPVSDMEIELDWQPVSGAAFYRVYRSTEPNFKPSQLTLVSMPSDCRFLDKPINHGVGWINNRLNPETKYYYRVEAVSRQNQRGTASAPVGAFTMGTATKACPPIAVADLCAILVSPVAPANQVNLLWRSNVEPNIAGYEIHRSTKPGFTPGVGTLLAKVDVQLSSKATFFKGLTHQMYLDDKPALKTTYYYKVRAITKDGLPGAWSNEASVATKKDTGIAMPLPQTKGKALLGNDTPQQ